MNLKISRLSILFSGLLICSWVTPSWAAASSQTAAKQPFFKSIKLKVSTQLQRSGSQLMAGIKGLPGEMKAFWQFQRAIRKNPLLRPQYRAEKRKRDTGWGKLAMVSCWSASVANFAVAGVLPGTQPLHLGLGTTMGGLFFTYNLEVGRALEAARVDTIRFGLRHKQRFDQRILDFYGKQLVPAARADLKQAKAQHKQAKEAVESRRHEYKQSKARAEQAGNRLTRWFRTGIKTRKLARLNRAKDQRREARQSINELIAELGQLTPKFPAD